MFSLFYDTKIVPQVLDNAADNETLVGSGVDMTGWDSAAFITTAQLGEELDLSMKIQEDDSLSFSDPKDLADSSQEFSSDLYSDGYAILDIHNPRKLCLRPSITVPDAVSAKAVSCVAILYNGKNLPVGLNIGKLLNCPAEGTA